MNIYNDSDAVSTVSSAIMNTPVTEDFQSATYPPTGWNILNPDASYTWERRTGITGATGTATNVNYINNYTYNAPGQEDYLVSYTVDLQAASTAELTFDVSYARYGVGFEDGLRVDVSTDCGLTWTPTGYLKVGLTLATAGTVTSLFTPSSAAQWRKDTVNLTPWIGNKVLIRFANVNDYGNSLYIDNVTMTSVVNNVTLNLSLFLEGYYTGAGQMDPVLFNAGLSTNPLVVDSIVARLHNTVSPYGVVAADTALLSTNGQAVFSFPAAISGNSYYISVMYRNSIQTWSKLPVLMNAITNYSFSNPSAPALINSQYRSNGPIPDLHKKITPEDSPQE
jgi:hypothetical protein